MNYYVLQLYHTWTINVLWIYCVLMYFQMRKYDQTVLKSPGIKTGKSFKSHLPNVFNQSSEGSKFAFPSSKSSTTVSFTISIVPVSSWILWVSQSYADVHICAPTCKKRFHFVYSIFLLLLYCHQHHSGGCFSCDRKKIQNSSALKKNYIVWNMCFKRWVFNVWSLSVAVNKNGKLLNLLYIYNGGQCILNHYSCLGNLLCLMENCCWTQSCLLFFIFIWVTHYDTYK